MRNKILVITKLLISAMFIIVACGPSTEEIATQTAAAWTATPTITNTPVPSPTPLPPTSTPTPEPSPTPQPITDAPTIEEILERTNLAMAAAQSYHFEMSVGVETSASGLAISIPMTFSGDYLSPDKMQATLNVELFGIVTETKFVTIGDLEYSTDIETGEWVLDAEMFLPIDPNDFVGANEIILNTPELVGIEVVDGIQTYHLVGVIPADILGEDFSGQENDVAVEYWIGVDDFLVRRLKLSLILFSEMVEGTGETELAINVDLTISEYGKEVVIEAPID